MRKRKARTHQAADQARGFLLVVGLVYPLAGNITPNQLLFADLRVGGLKRTGDQSACTPCG